MQHYPFDIHHVSMFFDVRFTVPEGHGAWLVSKGQRAGLTTMSLDFNKLREANKARAEAAKNAPRPPSELDRVRHLIEFHLTELTNWEEGFIYSQKEWLTKRPGNYLGEKPAKIVKEMEDKYCGSMCHALNKAGVPHG